MKKKVLIGVGIVVAVLAAAVLLTFVLKKKDPREKGSFTGRMYTVENGKKELQTEETYFFDSKGHVVYEFRKQKDAAPVIVRYEYDDLGRIVVTREYEKTFFGERLVGTLYTKYFRDTEEVIEYRSENRRGKVINLSTYDYDDAGREIYRKETVDDVETITRTEYNEQGTMISKSITIEGQTIVVAEYNPETNEVTRYQEANGWYREGENFGVRNVDAIDVLDKNGRIVEIKANKTRYNDETEEYETIMCTHGRYVYHPEDEKIDYEEFTYNEDGTPSSCWVYDKEGREIEIKYYDEGVVTRISETDYDGEDPDFPGEKITITKRYELDENGNRVLVAEVRQKLIPGFMADFPLQYQNTRPHVYYWNALEDGKWVEEVRTVFYDDGKMKEYHTKTSFGTNGEESISYYNEHGSMVRDVTMDADGNIIEEIVAEYTYY